MSRPVLEFLSPGVKTQEIDESQIDDPIAQLGPIIIGRTRKGPAGIPTRINGLDNYNSVFGKPVDGASGDDVWRNGIIGPTYASYAAHSWLASGTTPINVVRLLGEEDPDNPSGLQAGWEASQAYGLFICGADSRNVSTPTTASAALAAVFYTSDANYAVTLSGSIADETGGNTAATSTITVDDGTVQLSTSGIAEGDTITLNATDGTAFTFMVVDRGAGTTSATGTTAVEGASEGGLTISSAQAGNIILNLDLGGSGDNQFSILFQLDAAITAVASAKLTPSGLPGAAAAGNQSLTVTQVVSGFGGNKTNAKTGLSCTSVGDFVNGNEISSVGLGEVIKASGADYEFVAQIQSNKLTGTKEKDIVFNFNRSSARYIRNVFNTNPTLTNTNITPTQDQEKYWLGETFDRHLKSTITDTSASDLSAFILPLVDDAGNKWSNHKEAFTYAHSGWFISQDTGASADFSYEAAGVEKLFRCVARGGGAADNTAFKIGITDLKLPANTAVYQYGSFTLNVVEVGTDSVLESFPGLTLDHDSPDFILRRIGDKYLRWEITNGEGKYEELGENPNQSSYIRIEMYSSSNRVSNKSALPFGFLGPVRPKATANIINSASAGSSDWVEELDVATYGSGSQGSTIINHGSPADFAAKLEFPKIPLRISGSDGLNARPSRAYFGIQPTVTANSRKGDADYVDYLRPIATSGTGYNCSTATLLASTDTKYEYSFVFSLDNIKLASNTTTGWFYEDGSRAGGTSYTAANSVSDLLDQGVKRFYAPMFGGFDGLDITEREPLGNHKINASDTTENNYVLYTINKALQSIRDPETVPASLLLAPGYRSPKVTDLVVNEAQTRNDLLAIIDIEEDFVPSTERKEVVPSASQRGEVSTAVTKLNGRTNTDSSYACCFYPAIQVVDRDTSRTVYVPASVAGLGAMAQSQASSELWFAPAGFNRGGLGNLGGSRGPTAIQARQRLDSSQRDDLYEANINPIATFPNEGLVIFGQKTLQRSKSALDRINVRRLMIFLRHQISEIAKKTLFEQNNSSTRSKIRRAINNVLSDVQSRFGLSGYSLIIDETNNTADDIDNNRLNVTIFVKPTRAIEFIAIDFIITRSGVELAE